MDPIFWITHEYIIQYDKITNHKYTSKLWTCYIYNFVDKFHHNYMSEFKNANWNDYIIDMYSIELLDSLYDDNFNVITLYDHYNDSCIYINNYKIIVNDIVLSKSCNKYHSNMIIRISLNIDVFVFLIKYIYFDCSIDFLDDLYKITDFLHFYKRIY